MPNLAENSANSVRLPKVGETGQVKEMANDTVMQYTHVQHASKTVARLAAGNAKI